MKKYLRHPLTLILVGFLLAWLLLPAAELPEKGMQVELVNKSDVMIDNIRLDFGYSQGQSSIQSLRLPAGETRTLLLNHEPGAGFNVQVRYADGLEQDFCANQGEQGQYQKVILQR